MVELNTIMLVESSYTSDLQGSISLAQMGSIMADLLQFQSSLALSARPPCTADS